MTVIHPDTGHPVSVKAVVLHEGRVLLLFNERGEWDLPGGRPEAGEDFPRTVEREVLEESGARVRAERQIDAWAHEVLPGRFVWIVAIGCRALDLSDLKPSDEHERLGWFGMHELDRINLPAGYAAAVRAWAQQAG